MYVHVRIPGSPVVLGQKQKQRQIANAKQKCNVFRNAEANSKTFSFCFKNIYRNILLHENTLCNVELFILSVVFWVSGVIPAPVHVSFISEPGF